MDKLQHYIYEKIKDSILTWSAQSLDDIYVISLYVESIDDDPRRPSVTLGYNTVKQWDEMKPEASDSNEAKWNYAFWLQNCELLIGDNEKDMEFISMWINDLGLNYSDEDEEEDFDRTCELGELITVGFVKACVYAARQLHTDGIIKSKFNKDIPVLVHELEYYDLIAEQNKAANPDGVADEFIAWIESG